MMLPSGALVREIDKDYGHTWRPMSSQNNDDAPPGSEPVVTMQPTRKTLSAREQGKLQVSIQHIDKATSLLAAKTKKLQISTDKTTRDIQEGKISEETVGPRTGTDSAVEAPKPAIVWATAVPPSIVTEPAVESPKPAIVWATAVPPSIVTEPAVESPKPAIVWATAVPPFIVTEPAVESPKPAIVWA
jgi:hypothetical protein